MSMWLTRGFPINRKKAEARAEREAALRRGESVVLMHREGFPPMLIGNAAEDITRGDMLMLKDGMIWKARAGEVT